MNLEEQDCLVQQAPHLERVCPQSATGLAVGLTMESGSAWEALPLLGDEDFRSWVLLWESQYSLERVKYQGSSEVRQDSSEIRVFLAFLENLYFPSLPPS